MAEASAQELIDVSVARGGKLLLSGVAFTAPPGAFLALRGPNGSGKTSLLRAVAGLARLHGGDVRFGDLSRSADPEAFREAILYGGHLDAVKPSLTVRENLSFWTKFYRTKDAADRTQAALERFGLDGMAEVPAGQCSAGQKRRLGLARLAACDRPVWLLDEPTVSLDAASVEQLSTLVAEHCLRGGAAIAATHQDFAISESRSVDVGAFKPRAETWSGGAAQDDPFLQGFDRDLGEKPTGGR